MNHQEKSGREGGQEGGENLFSRKGRHETAGEWLTRVLQEWLDGKKKAAGEEKSEKDKNKNLAGFSAGVVGATGAVVAGDRSTSLSDVLDPSNLPDAPDMPDREKKPTAKEPKVDGKKSWRERAKEKVQRCWKSTSEWAKKIQNKIGEKLCPSAKKLSEEAVKNEGLLKGTKRIAETVAKEAVKPEAVKVVKEVVQKVAEKVGKKVAMRAAVQGAYASGVLVPLAVVASVGLAGYEIYNLLKEEKSGWNWETLKSGLWIAAGYTPGLGALTISGDVANAVSEATTGKSAFAHIEDRAQEIYKTALAGGIPSQDSNEEKSSKVAVLSERGKPRKNGMPEDKGTVSEPEIPGEKGFLFEKAA